MSQVAWISQLRFLARLLTVFICLGLASCASIQKPHSPVITVTDNTGEKFEFSGKGAGAGMMMAGSMGAMGIAIGVAIDVGIAKDIREALEQLDENWLGVLEVAIDRKILVLCSSGTLGIEPGTICARPELEFRLDKVKFFLRPEDDGLDKEDATVVEIELSALNQLGRETKMLRFSLRSERSESLEELKKDGNKVIDLLVDSVQALHMDKLLEEKSVL